MKKSSSDDIAPKYFYETLTVLYLLLFNVAGSIL